MSKSKYIIVLLINLLILILVLSITPNMSESSSNQLEESYSISDSIIWIDVEKYESTSYLGVVEGGMPCENPEQFQEWYETYEHKDETKLKVIHKKPEINEVQEDLNEQETVKETEETSVYQEGDSWSDEGSDGSWDYECDDEVCYESSEENEERVIEEEKEVIPYVSPTIPHYSVNGAVLDLGLQDYVYTILSGYGREWMHTLVLCQIYQESRFDQSSRNYHDDGTVDVGLMQIKSKYHHYLSTKYGVPDCDLYNDSYLNVYVGVNLLMDYYSQCWDSNQALSAYNTGSISSYSQAYINQVRRWEPTVSRIY